MDDFSLATLRECRNEICARLLILLTPVIIEGFRSILQQAVQLCKDNREERKYLLTFQQLVGRVPKWNANIIEDERKRIVEQTKCAYLEDLITLVHVNQLKALTAVRVGHKQKKIEIDIPKLDTFLHKAYIHCARKIYQNAYLFELSSAPLEIQKHNRELELIVQECILNAIRESIPIESILNAYMNEAVEEDVVEEFHEVVIPPVAPLPDVAATTAAATTAAAAATATATATATTPTNTSLSFNDFDVLRSESGEHEIVNAPKDIDRLEQISTLRNLQRKLEDEQDGGNSSSSSSSSSGLHGDRLVIGEEEDPSTFDLSSLDITPVASAAGVGAGANVDMSLEEFMLGDIETV